MMAPGRPLVLPGCYNALTARILEHAGHEALYITGYGTSLSLLGLPDAGLITLTEMALNAKLIASAVRAPVIADADTGFGNAINVVRTVEEYIRAGLAGMHVEDQVAPKRCGHVAGREVVDRAEAVGKIRAAHAARQALDPDFILIARTDARGAHGGSLDEAIARANLFLEAGADMAFVEGPASKAEIAEVCRRVRGPILYNQTGISPRLSEAEMAELGIAITILPGAVLRQTIMAVHDLAVAMKTGRAGRGRGGCADQGPSPGQRPSVCRLRPHPRAGDGIPARRGAGEVRRHAGPHAGDPALAQTEGRIWQG